MNLYVGNLNFEVTEEEIRNLFNEIGTVESVNLKRDKVTGQSKGFAFVEMPDLEESVIALKTLNGRDFHGRNIVVNMGNDGQKDKKQFNQRREGGYHREGGQRRDGGFNRDRRDGGFNKNNSYKSDRNYNRDYKRDNDDQIREGGNRRPRLSKPRKDEDLD